MSAESHLELFLMLFGWQQYNNLWGILTATGLAYIPVVLVVISTLVEAVLDAPAAQAGPGALRRLELRIVLLMSAIVLAVQPSPITVLTPSVLHHVEPCTGARTSPDAGTGTTYDTPFETVLSEVQVPAWWYGVLALSGGVTRAAVAGIGCVEDLSGYRIAVAGSRIQDPVLLNELGRFLSECYVPARSRFYREQPEVSALVASYGPNDTEWFGSHTYRELPGYYDRLRARQPVKGWPLELTGRDVEYDIPDVPPPAYGRPGCREWYEHEPRGLRAKLLEALPPTLLARGRTILASVGFGEYTQARMTDDTIRTLVTQSVAAAPANASFVSSFAREGVLSGKGAVPLVGNVNLPLLGAGLGSAWENVSFSPMIYAVKTGAPIVQALLLASIYALLPIALLFGNYGWTTILAGTIGIFALKFWSYLWHVARWLEDNLTQALYPEGTGFFSGAGMANLTDMNFALKVLLLEMTVGAMFIGLPILFSAIVAWGGSRAAMLTGHALGTLSAPSAVAGQTGGRISKGVAGNAGRRLGG